jgi:hypothetical protein
MLAGGTCLDYTVLAPTSLKRGIRIKPILESILAKLQENLASLELDLSAEQVKSLDEASGVEAGFPHYLYNAQMTRALAYGGMRDRIVA